MNGRVNDNADAMIGDDTQSLAGKESFDAGHFNDGGGGNLGEVGKQVVEKGDSGAALGGSDNAGI